MYSIEVYCLTGIIVEKDKSPKRDLIGENLSLLLFSIFIYSSKIFDIHPAINPANMSSTIGPKPPIIPGFASS
mgnify:CR=1 FL=1